MLPQHVSAAKKTISRQNKAIEDLRKDLAHSQQACCIHFPLTPALIRTLFSRTTKNDSKSNS